MFKIIKQGIKHKLFLNGSWKFSSSKEFINVINPYNNKLVSKVSAASKKDAKHALRSACKARNKMEDLTPQDRYGILTRAWELLESSKKLLTRTIIKESGKPLKWAEGEVHATIERVKYAASEARNIEGRVIRDDSSNKRIALVVKEPIGTVTAISPFNYPLFTGASKTVEAIASGNSVILKPPSEAPTVLLEFARLLEKAGVPKGGLNVITGRGSEIGDFIVSDSRVNMVSFTGSSNVGKNLAKKIGIKKVILELGGKCPAIILKDADLRLAAKECVKGCFKLSGQRCDAISKVIIIDDCAEEFKKLVLKELKEWGVGNPAKKNVLIGPLINQKAVEKVNELIDDALKKKAVMVKGGTVRGLTYYPTILDKVTDNMRISKEEIFGPVMPIMRVKNEKQALKEGLNSDYGLDACIFTKDVIKAMNYSLGLQEGSVHVNRAPTHGVGKFPFGGNKNSGVYREGVAESINQMTKKKTIILNF